MSSAQASRCPRCAETPLRSLRTQHGTMGFCTRCQGHWVTAEAGDFLVPLLTQLVERLAENVGHGRCAQGLHPRGPGQERCEQCPPPSLRCPACARRMLPLQTHGQAVDFCTHCPGLWLDANELAALRGAHARPLSARVPVQGLTREPLEAPRASLGASAGSAAAEGALSWLVEVLLRALF